MFGRNRLKPEPKVSPIETASGVPITVSHSTNRVGCRARMNPGSWYQNRQDEQGRHFPFVVIEDLAWGVKLQAVNEYGEPVNFQYTVANAGAKIR